MAGIVNSALSAPPAAPVANTRDDYIEYATNGGTLSMADWIKAGKPKK